DARWWCKRAAAHRRPSDLESPHGKKSREELKKAAEAQCRRSGTDGGTSAGLPKIRSSRRAFQKRQHGAWHLLADKIGSRRLRWLNTDGASSSMRISKRPCSRPCGPFSSRDSTF